MANPIRKVVQFVFDRASGQRTEADAKKALKGVEGGLGRLKRVALSVGAVMAAAFSVRAIVRFGKESIRAASEAGAIWNRLAGTIEGVGIAFESVEPEIRALARAMQDATTVGDEDFAEVLQTLTDISRDYEGSLRNVSVVADLAAAKQIDLGTAAKLVGRAMVGETALLKRYGIVVAEGSDAVQVMREQFAGMAANEAQTFQGRIKQLTNEWFDFKQAVGDALIEAGGGTSLIQTLTGVVKGLTQAVERNREVFSGVAVVLQGLVKVVGLVFEGWGRLANLFNGVVIGAFAGVLRVVAGLSDATALATEASVKFYRAIGAKGAAEAQERDAKRIRDRAAALRELADISQDAAAASLQAGMALRPPRQSTADEPFVRRRGAVPTPSTGDTEDAKDAQKALNAALAEAARITESVRTPTEVYNDTLANLRVHLEAGRISQETYARAAEDAAEAYEKAAAALDPVADAIARHDQALQSSATMSALLGDEWDALGVEAASLQATMAALADAGVDPLDERMRGFADRLREIRALTTGFEEDWRAVLEGTRTVEMATQNVAYGVARAWEDAFGLIFEGAANAEDVLVAFAQGMGSALLGGLADYAGGKVAENIALAFEENAKGIAAAANPFLAWTAPAHFLAAKAHAVTAAKWTVLGGLAAAGASAISGRGGGGGGASASRDAGGPRSERMQAPGPEVHIYFEGAGFDAVNPEVQRVIAGAQRNIEERYGPNATVRTHRRGRG